MKETSVSTSPPCTEAESASEWRSLTAVGRELAHDLRSPVNGIVLQVELLSADLQNDVGPDPTTIQRRVESLERELARLRGPLEALLAFLSPPTATETWDVGEVIREVVRVLEPAARQRGATISSVGPGAPFFAVGHRARFRGLLLSVLVSLLEDLAEGGGIGIDVEASGEVVCVGIFDDGPPRPPQEAPAWVERLSAMATTLALMGASSSTEVENDGRTRVILSLPRGARGSSR